jgi:hypothetical protein
MHRALRIALAMAPLLTLSRAAFTQTASTFETAVVKPCKPGEMRPGIDAGGGNGKRENPDAARGPSPGYLELNCYPLRLLISFAYVDFADGHLNKARQLRTQLEGGPDWVRSDSDTYAVTARASGPASQATMRGPMLRAA